MYTLVDILPGLPPDLIQFRKVVALAERTESEPGQEVVTCLFQAELEQLHTSKSANQQKMARGMYELLARAATARHGERPFTYEICHTAFEEHFDGVKVTFVRHRKGALRTISFMEAGVMVCVSCVVKRQDKYTPRDHFLARETYELFVQHIKPRLTAILQELNGNR